MNDNEVLFYAVRPVTRGEILEWAKKELAKETHEKLRFNLDNDAQTLIEKIKNSHFGAGEKTEAYTFFNELINKDRTYAFEVMMKTVQKEALNSDVVTGIMHVLSNIPYEIANPLGITIALACGVLSTITTEAKECFITCFGKLWAECPSAIYALENLKLNDDEQRLKYYRDEVLKDLKEKTTQKEGE